MRRELERIEIPGEHEARARAWAILRAAYADREPQPPPRPLLRPLLVACVLAAVVAAALSSPGRAVLESVREAVGVDSAERSLFELPSGGRLLVDSSVGPWVVEADGSKRLLGDYREATWSPFGRYVAAVRGVSELVALEPGGRVRWSLPRRNGVALPRWGGSHADTRIAYVSGTTLRVVGGDGKGDRLLAPSVAAVAPAWRPGTGHVVAYATPHGRVVVRNADSGRVLWRGRESGRVTSLEWSSDARRLFVRRLSRADLYTGDGRLWSGIRITDGRVTALAFRPGSHAHAYAYTRDDRFQAAVVAEPSRPLLSGRGSVDRIVWAPNGRWALVSWPNAGQWVFVRSEGRPQVVAVADVAVQFRSSSFPRISGWCCP